MFVIERPSKYGGDVEVDGYGELEKLYREGKIHPLDLKHATAKELNEIILPVRRHFETGKAKQLYDFVKGEKVTR